MTRADYDQTIIDNAAYFTAVKFLGRGRYQREERPTLEAAIAAGRTMRDHRGVLIYAVAADGRSVHVQSV